MNARLSLRTGITVVIISVAGMLAGGPATAQEHVSCPKLDCADLPNGEYPNPENCSSFCMCVGGESVWKDCPAGLHFNPKLKVCESTQKANCKVEKPAPASPK